MAPDPSRSARTFSTSWTSHAVAAAVAIGLFTSLGRRRLTAAEIARRTGARPDRIERLCDYLAHAGYVRKHDGRYRASDDVDRLLNRQSPGAIADAAHFFHVPAIMAAFAGLGETVQGRTTGRRSARSRDALWRTFARRTLPNRLLYAREIADELGRRGVTGNRLLDIGAGASPLGIELLLRNPAARLTVQDRAGVVVAAREHARRAGVGRRVAFVRGDALTTDVGGPFDLALLINVLDYLDRPGRTRLLRKVRRVLAPGGVLAIGAPLLNPRRTSPPDAVAYDLLLLALGAAGRPFTPAELTATLEAASFSAVTRPAGGALVLARRPLKA